MVAFDNVGVGATTGRTPSTVEAMAHDAIAFVDALGLERIDLLGFSIGSFVAQEIALIRPDLPRRIVLASAAPQGAAGMRGWAPEVIAEVGGREPNPQGYLDVFFAHTDTSRQAGQEAAGRSDPMILPRYSYLLAGLLPDARLKLYPDSAHGFLFQHHEEFAADVHAFLEETD